MTTTAPPPEVRSFGQAEVVRLPAYVRGELRWPPWPRVGQIGAALAGHRPVQDTGEGSYLLVQPVIDRDQLAATGQVVILVVPALHPRDLLEPDPAGAVRELMRLPLAGVCDFVDAVGAQLDDPETGARTSLVADRHHSAVAAQLRGLFAGPSLHTMLITELGEAGVRAMDSWMSVPAAWVSGVVSRMSSRDDPTAIRTAAADQPRLRAVPTTQLHITAGNSPLVLATSLLWGWATKGACLVKPAARAVGLAAALGTAITAADPEHPLARHTTIAYWPGGDSAVERVLLADGAVDRRLIWGSAEAVTAVTRHGPATDTIVMRPRHAVSLIGSAALGANRATTARWAAADSVVADQQACMSSLLHVVQGSDAEADAYAEVLQHVLARWDDDLPHRMDERTLGAITGLRRGRLATAGWRINRRAGQLSSAVVRLDRAFDLREHPGGRLVLVRAVPDLRSALPGLVGPDVSHVGVTPDALLRDLADDLVAAGVDNVAPLGEAERIYAGRPHDGMRVLSRLLRWVNG